MTMPALRTAPRLAVLVAALALTMTSLVLAGPFAAVAAAQDEGGADATTTTVVELPGGDMRRPSIIPLPNSGSAPVEQGDPGSASQYAVLFGTLGGLAVIGLLIVRESRRKLREREAAAAPAESAAEPDDATV